MMRADWILDLAAAIIWLAVLIMLGVIPSLDEQWATFLEVICR